MSEEFENETFYQIWRRGGNPDAVHPDRVADAEQEGFEPDEFAAKEVERQRCASRAVRR